MATLCSGCFTTPVLFFSAIQRILPSLRSVRLQAEIYPHDYNTKAKYPSLLSVILGNFIEYYDYALYGFLATIMAQHFFPSSSESLALIQTFGVFAIGSLSKPLGALVFGNIGDRTGRKLALRWNMLGIAVPTFIIALLPGYLAWGLWSPLCLIICRVFQGFFLGGESDGVRIYVLEYVKNYPCLANSVTSLSSSFGIYVASFLASQVLNFSYYDQLWRLLFALGGIMGVVVFFMRRYIHETPIYTAKKHTPLHSWKSILKTNYIAFISTILLTGSVGGMYHFFMIFLGSYLSKILKIISVETAAYQVSISILCYTISAPLGGFLADILGAKRVMYYSGFLLLLSMISVSYFIIYNIAHLPSFVMISIFLGIFSAPGYVLIINQFQVKDRYRSIAVGHALGSMAFSGTTPIIAMALWNFTQQSWVVFGYFIFLLIIGFIALNLLKYNSFKHSEPIIKLSNP